MDTLIVTYTDGSTEEYDWVKNVRIEDGFLQFTATVFDYEVVIPVSQIRKYVLK